MSGSSEIARTMGGGYGESCERRGSWCGASEGWKFGLCERTGGHFCQARYTVRSIEISNVQGMPIRLTLGARWLKGFHFGNGVGYI